MPSKHHTSALYGWYPTNGGETRHQRERRIAHSWIHINLPASIQEGWLCTLADGPFRKTSQDMLLRISNHDTSELVELLYPRNPGMFHTAQRYTLSSALFPLSCDGPFSPEMLQQIFHSRTGRLCASCLFALTGAVDCLEALLELGADPDGLDTLDSWSYIELPNDQLLPVTPMDCALLADNEYCQFVL